MLLFLYSNMATSNHTDLVSSLAVQGCQDVKAVVSVHVFGGRSGQTLIPRVVSLWAKTEGWAGEKENMVTTDK